MVNLHDVIEKCERTGLDCAIFYAVNFPRLFDTVPTHKQLRVLQPGALVQFNCLYDLPGMYMEPLHCRAVISVNADDRTLIVSLWGHPHILPFAAVFKIVN
jgi:hypothetical protein